tara:strand:+ start:202 stop:486 length:285 start_codon:yes stop_codon:yes gene_type:complete
MSDLDKSASREGIDAELLPKSISAHQFDQGVFPFDAFTHEDPANTDNPLLRSKDNWWHGAEQWIDTDDTPHSLTISTSEPSGGSNNDIWFVREA